MCPVRRFVALFVPALLCVTIVPFGQVRAECIDYSDYLHWLARIHLPEPPKDLAVQGDFAYVASGASGLLIVNIADPAAPSIVGSVALPGNAWQVAVSGHRICVSDSVYDLRILDATDPAHPVEVGLLVLHDYVRDIALFGRFAYLAMGNTGLQVVDLGILTIPTLVGTLDTPGFAQAVTAGSGIAYIGDGTNGVIVADVADPRYPVALGRTPVSGEIRDLRLIGGCLCVAAHLGGLVVVDVSDPGNPFVRGSFPAPEGGYFDRVAGSGTNVFVSLGYSFDISEPTPRLIGIAPIGAVAGLAYSAGSIIGVQGDQYDVAYYLWSIDYHNAASPSRIGAVDLPQGGVQDVAISGTHAFVARDQGMTVLDVSDPSAPAIVGSVSTVSAYGLTLHDRFAWLAGGPSGSAQLVCVDVADPTAPFVVGQIGLSRAIDVAISGNFAFVAAYTDGLFVVDVSDPAHPLLVTQLPEIDASDRITVSGDHAYVADVSRGLAVVDISDPYHPFLAGTPQPPFGWGEDVEVVGDYAFVGTRFSGVNVVDVTNPAAPRTVGSDPFSYGPEHIDVAGGIVYSSSRMVTSMFVTDVTDPTHPRYLGHTPLFGISGDDCYRAAGIATSGSAVFVGLGTCGIRSYPLQCGLAAADPPALRLPEALVAQPNPMRSSTTLRWSVPQRGEAVVRVLDAGGRIVRTLASGPVAEGAREIRWDGLDSAGRPVAPGVYFLQAAIGGSTAESKVVRVE